MTLQDIADRISEIRKHSNDAEAAHAMEDDLWADVLRAIATGCNNPAGYAHEALKTKNIKFARWCA